MALLGYLGGYQSSSSRIELVGTIMAMLANFPVHLAGDNLSVVNRASSLRAWLIDHPLNPPPGKPFSLCKNGDLWDIFFKQLAARGPRSFRIKKTKGHALEHKEFLEKNPHLRWEAAHNNTVDRLANAARYNFFNKHHIHLSGILAKRASKYVDFVICVHNVIFKMHIFLQQLRVQEANPMALSISTPSNILHACPDLNLILPQFLWALKLIRVN